MVYGLMKQLGGTVKIYSEIGAGTTVKLFLPVATAASSSVAQQGRETSVKGNGETILVVEDDSMVRESVADQLAGLDYRVICACNGPEALDKLA